MGVSIIAVLLIDLQKIIILPLGKVGGYTIIPTYILLILTGYELYERREAIQSNKKYGFIGIVMYFLAHAALTFLQIMLYKRDYNTGHVFSWDSSFAIIGAVGLSVFCLSLSIERRMTQKIIRFLGKYTFPVYLVHLLVIRKANSSLIWKKLFALSERGIFGELCYTVIAIFYVFLISLVVVTLVNMVVALIKKGLNLHRE